MSLARIRAQFTEREDERLRLALADVALHIGGDTDRPWTVVQAAETARRRLNQLQGHTDIPRDADGRPVPYNVVGR